MTATTANAGSLMWLAIPIAAVIAIIVTVYLILWIFKQEPGSEKMQEVSAAIREGAFAFLKRQYTTIYLISVAVAIILFFVPMTDETGSRIPGFILAGSYILGAICSGLAGYIGMYTSVHSNLRTARGAMKSLDAALQVALRGGAVTGLSVVTLSLVGVGLLYWLVSDVFGYANKAPLYIVGFGFGASFVALFAQLGGGIYTKAADVGADLVGKVEAGIPEDDPRNPAVIADLVGDNVGDCAGRGADLFESTAAENIGAMILGVALYPFFGIGGILFPLVVRAFGLIGSIIGIFFSGVKETENPLNGLKRGYLISSILAVVGIGISTYGMLNSGGTTWWYFFIAGIVGVLLAYVFVLVTQYYTDYYYKPVKDIAEACQTGPATAMIQGTAVGFECTAIPTIAIVIAILASYKLGQLGFTGVEGVSLISAGLYGTAIATMGMLSTCAFVLAMDTFGPITDNAGGIVQMCGEEDQIRERADRLDSAGNSTKAITKGYAVGSAALAAFLLFAAYIDKVKFSSGIPLDQAYPVDIGKPEVFAAAFIGCMLVLLFSAWAIKAVGRTAQTIILEVRRQIKEMGILEGKNKPDYARCVDIVTIAALKEMILPGLLPVVVAVLVGVFLKAEAAAGFLMVATITGVIIALYLNNAGGAMDNAKKYIELGHFGGKGSDAHKAGVVIDTVGDPFKDTAGPSLHVLIKLLSTITLVLCGLFIAKSV
jgi:K(+)-stimulated pyrophosphate-energized sodium pump